MCRATTTVATLILAFALAGCSSPRRWFTNRSIVRDPLVQFPTGGGIYVKIEQTERFGRRERTPEQYVWEQPDRPAKVLAVIGDPRPARVDPASRTSEIADDGESVRLLESGRTIATFDYPAGTATFAR